MANNAWAEAKWVVNQLESSGSSSSSSGVLSFAPNNIPSKKLAYAGEGVYKLIYTWPGDSYIDSVLVSTIKGVKVVLYTNESDLGDHTAGTTLHTSTTKNEYSTSSTAFVIDGSDYGMVEGETYWIQLYPFNTEYGYNVNTTNVLSFQYFASDVIYAVRVNKSDSDPTTRVEYVEGYINENYEPAGMDYTTSTFDYGDWAGAWFMDVKPCILNYDGTVQKYLNPDNYAEDEDGYEVDITTTDLDGNVMIEIPTVWLKMYEEDDYQYYFIANAQIDEDYHAYAHTDLNGNIMPYTYIAAYEGYVADSVMRSISGVTSTASNTATSEITYATANNQTEDEIWYTRVYSDWVLLQALLLLIGKSTDGQTVFGSGNSSGSAYLVNGTMDDKGLFWGDTTGSNGVKVFGIENFWGDKWDRIAGLIKISGSRRVKMTYGMEDGSTTTGYNTTASGYITPVTNSVTSSGYISGTTLNEYGLATTAVSGSASTYECDYEYNTTTSGTYYGHVGGVRDVGSSCGPWCATLYTAASNTAAALGASLSCKPLA